MKKISRIATRPAIHLTFIFLLLMTCMTNDIQARPSSNVYADPPAIIGRWDLTITRDAKQSPSWLEVTHSGLSTLVGRFVGSGGSARPIAKINFKDGKFNFSIPPQWEPGPGEVVFEGTLQDDKLTGTITGTDGKTYNWTGVRAPLLKRDKEIVWGEPATLFNGKDLSGWHASGANQWIAESGVLKSPKSGSNILTDQTFNDFKLHVEFRYPKGSNSGVYLRGRYEVQIEDNKGMEPQPDFISAIYGFLPPSEIAAHGSGEWETYDISLVGRMVTVVMNGKTVISNQQIPGITGGAIDSKEGEPGPIMFQGDHGPIEFRNISVAVPK